MKTRTGFVSNSSSSSFIASLGVVTDVEQFREHFKFNLSTDKWPSDVKITTLGEIKEDNKNNRWCDIDYSEKQERISTEGLGGSVIVSVSTKDLPDSTIVYMYSECGGEPEYDEYGDYDYDIDYDFFGEEMQKLAEIVNLPFMKGEISYGAGYDG